MRPLTVLVVDDNARMRATVRAILLERAADVIECADGDDAVEVYERVHPDAVFMDVAMTRIDGIRATEMIRAQDPSAYVVIVSEYTDAAIRAAATAAGAAGYVTKDDLTAVLELLPSA